MALASIVALLASMWVASQASFFPTLAVKFAASLYLIFEASPVLAAMWLGAAGWGYPLRRLVPMGAGGATVQLALGMAVMLLLNWLLAWAGWLHGWSAWGLCTVGAVGLAAQAVVNRHRLGAGAWWGDSGLPWPLVLAALPVGVMLVAATCPPGTLWRVEAYGYDVLSYHLQLPRQWLELGAMQGLHHNVYSYLPSLVEAAYMQIGAMRGSIHQTVYTCQLFHASLGVLAAAAVGEAVAARANRTAGAIAGAAMLAVPWMLITGSLAYNEMAMLAMGGGAIRVALDPAAGRSWRGAAAAGLLLGAATLAKLTAGLLLAIPVGVLLATGLNQVDADQPRPPWRSSVGLAAIAALAGLLTLTPYFIRNAVWTGNPVFPFATSLLGYGHWDEQLAQRWDRGHGLTVDETGGNSSGNSGVGGDSASHSGGGATTSGGGGDSAMVALARQWLFNTGYGAVGGHATPVESRNIARFDTEGGVPVWGLAVGASFVFLLCLPGWRRVALAMGMLLALQVIIWMALTHLQSRFLMPTLLPGAILIGLGSAQLDQRTRREQRWMTPLLVSGMILVLTALSFSQLMSQTIPLTLEDGRRVRASPGLLIDSLGDPTRGRPGLAGGHPINQLPASSCTLLVADNARLFYIRRPFVYHSAFDASPLGRMIRQAQGDPEAVNLLLKQEGITHVWVHWGELDRLHATYGYDPDVTRETLSRLIASGWRQVPLSVDTRTASLYALPR